MLTILSLISVSKTSSRDFPGSPVAKNLPAIAGDMGSIPGLVTKILHAMWQVGPCVTTSEAHAT